MTNLPRCPRHARSTVWKDGFYGQPRRQRYRCVPKGHAEEWHRFTEPLPRVRTVDGQCDHCERPLASHEGPPAPRWHEFPVRQIAATLVDVGQGVSYRQAGHDARQDHGRVRDNAQEETREGTLAAGWVEVFGPVVHGALDNHAAWPDILLLDALPVIMRTGGRGGRLAFTVLAAGGYRKPHGEQEVWALWANHTGNTADWAAFLRQRPGRPSWVVCDFSNPTINAIMSVWEDDPPAVWLCDWHLRHNLEEKLDDVRVPRTDWLWQTASDAYNDTASWDVYRDQLRRYPDYRLAKWLDHGFAPTGRTREEQISWQIANRSTIDLAGLPRTTGALEAELAILRSVFKGRQHAYRNQERTNRMLQLFQLERNGRALTRTYARHIRDHLKTHGGETIVKRRRLFDQGEHTLRP